MGWGVWGEGREPRSPDPPLKAFFMQGEIILTGTELVTGQVAEVNARYAARRLHETGLSVRCITMLGDGDPLFGVTLGQAMRRSRFVIITGGLGPTDDDLTVAQAAEVLNLKLIQDEGMLARMRQRARAAGFYLGPAVWQNGLDTGRRDDFRLGALGLRFFPEAPGHLAFFSARSPSRNAAAV